MVEKTKAAEENLPSIWEQFNELQRAANGSGRILEPRGVFRFKTFEEFNAWKDHYHPKKPRVSNSQATESEERETI